MVYETSLKYGISKKQLLDIIQRGINTSLCNNVTNYTHYLILVLFDISIV